MKENNKKIIRRNNKNKERVEREETLQQSFPFYLLASREHFDPPDIESGHGGVGGAGKDAINDATVGLERLRCEVARCTLGVVVVDTEVIADGRTVDTVDEWQCDDVGTMESHPIGTLWMDRDTVDGTSYVTTLSAYNI